MQSFVLDLKVNDVLRQKGFDMAPIEGDLAASIESLGRAIDAGYHPEHPREEVFMALTLASKMLDEDRGIGTGLARIDTTLTKVRTLDARLAKLARRLRRLYSRQRLPKPGRDHQVHRRVSVSRIRAHR